MNAWRKFTRMDCGWLEKTSAITSILSAKDRVVIPRNCALFTYSMRLVIIAHAHVKYPDYRVVAQALSLGPEHRLPTARLHSSREL